MEKFPQKHPLHIKTPELQKSEEVQKSVEKQERLNDEKLPNDPTERIEAHMARLENIFLNPNENKRKRNLEMLKPAIYNEFIINPEEVPESYFELQQRIARERGQEVEEIPQDVREEMINTIIEDQRHSLDQWIDYLTSGDAVYPTWFKYFVFQNITKLSQFDKSLGKFKKRTNETTAPYPDVFREPLAQICDVYEKVAQDNNLLKTDPEVQREFSKSFPKLYAEKISESLASSIENKENIKGKWVKYEQGTAGEAERLYDSLQGRGTGWCTAGESTARTQMKSGDFYVYYSEDDKGEATQPRLAIRMDENDKIGEVRGINPHQEVEPIMSDILDSKLSEFGNEAEKYKKKSADMKKLTEIDEKIKENPNAELTPEELKFLYEINSPIEGFGYQKDPRIAELREGRDIEGDIATMYGFDLKNPDKRALEFIYNVGINPTPSVFHDHVEPFRQDRNIDEDMLIIFECTKDQIAHSLDEIDENTKAYVGELEPGIFQKLPETLEHVYISFPEKKIRRETIEIGGKSKEQLISEMQALGINISDYAKSMMENPDFITGTNREETKLVRLTVADLGFKTSATTDQIYERAQALGLELCPPDTGPNYRLKYKDQPLNKSVRIGMKQITDSDGDPSVFYLDRSDGGVWLGTCARPGYEWNPGNEFVFRFRKVET